MTKIKCPFCGYTMPIFIDKAAECRGLTVTCKARHCKRRFEIIVKKGKQTDK